MPMYEGIGLTGDKQAVVIDFGTSYTKFGFTGEAAPRCIIRSEVKCPDTKQVKQVHEYANKEELHQLLVAFIHQLYFKHLLVSPKDRRVVIVESLLATTIFRETLAQVLFNHFEVLSLLFVPSHLVAPCTLGIRTALVLDVGYQEAVLIPVFEGIPILHAWQAQPLAARAVHRSIKSQLCESACDATLRGEMEGLAEGVVEDVKVRACFVTTLERARRAEAGDPAPPPPPVRYQACGNIAFEVPGAVREMAMEVMFERDNDQMSVSTMVLDAIVKCPMDMRKPLAENILLVGGTTMAAGFRSRLQAELRHLVETPKYASKLAIKLFKFHVLPAKENYVAWLGGAIFGSTELLQTRSLTKEAYLKTNTVPDWSNLSFNRKEEGSYCL